MKNKGHHKKTTQKQHTTNDPCNISEAWKPTLLKPLDIIWLDILS